MSPLLATMLLSWAQAVPACESLDLGPLACVASGRGVVVAETATEAQRIAAFAVAGEDRFERHFRRSAAPYLVLWGVGDRGLRIAEAAPDLEVFVFNSPAQRVARVQTATRAAVEAQFASLPAAQRASAIEAALAGMPQPSVDTEEAKDAGTVPHELGHLWFRAAFWPEADMASLDYYVTPAPDWLDEAAAMQMEGDAGPRFDRLAEFSAAGTRVWDLPTLLAKEHPGQILKRIVSEGAAPADGWSMEELRALGIDADAIPVFYAQSAAFAAFLVEKTGNPSILADVAQWIARGGSFQSWLECCGGALGLGSSVDEIEHAWSEWLHLRGIAADRNAPAETRMSP